jgi:hypothetical protein
MGQGTKLGICSGCAVICTAAATCMLFGILFAKNIGYLKSPNSSEITATSNGEAAHNYHL